MTASLVLVLSVVGFLGSKSADGSWTPLGPFGADGWYTLSLAIDPASPSTVFAGTRGFDGVFGIFRSSNGGLTWDVVKILHDPTLNAQPAVPSLVIDPLVTSTVYAAVSELGITKSTDGGATWTWMNEGLSSLFITSLVLDPSTPSTLYATTRDGIYKSIDGAAHWFAHDTGRLGAICLAVDPKSSSTVYAGAFTGVYKSNDGGERWTLLNSGSFPTWVTSIAINPLTPSTFYVATNGETSRIGLYKTDDGGASWVPANNGLPGFSLKAVVLDSGSPSTVYACTNGGVARSTDGGQSWKLLGQGGGSVVAVDSSSSTICVGGGAVVCSNDGGVTWTAPTDSLFPIPITRVAAGATTPRIYAATELKGILASEDGGRSWTRSGGRIPSVTALLVDPSSDAVVYAANADGVFKTVDGAATWERAGLDGLPVASLVINPVASATLYAGTTKGGLFKTTNGGTSWTMIGSLPGSAAFDSVTALAIDPARPSTVYAGTQTRDFFLNGSVFKSVDGGLNWTSASQSVTEGVLSLVVDPSSPSTIFAGTRGFYGVFRSLDEGLNWSPLRFGPSVGLAIDPGFPSTLYIANSIVFRSSEGSKLLPMYEGLTYVIPHSIAVVPSLSVIYLGTQVGVFRADMPRELDPVVPGRHMAPRRVIPRR